MTSGKGAEALGSGYFRIGPEVLAGDRGYNTYLLVDGGEALLFDPGPASEVGGLTEHIASLTALDTVKYIVLHDPGPDPVSAVLRLEALGMHFTVVTHPTVWPDIQDRGVSSSSCLVGELGYTLKLASGRILEFVPTPYLQSLGAIASYDGGAGFLLSGNLFAAFAPLARIFSDFSVSAILPGRGPVFGGDAAHLIDASARPGGVGSAGPPTISSDAGIAIYDSLLRESRENAESLSLEIARLRQLNEELGRSAGSIHEDLFKDAVTGLYNETYFRNFIDEEATIALSSEEEDDDVLAVIGIDEGMARIEYQYGPREVEAILKGISRIILDAKGPGNPAFRLHGATFALWIPHTLFKKANELCDGIRKGVETSPSFIEPVTVSIGLVAIADIRDSTSEIPDAGATMADIGLRRLRFARKRGGNTICSSSEVGKEVELKARILIADDDPINADVVKTFLENADYAVSTAVDGDDALRKIGEEGYDLIISELMIPKVDGFMLKESLSLRSGTKDIPFILLSHLKDEKSVIRAYKLGIDYYLKKPFLLAELLGIVQKMTAAGTAR